LVRRGARIRKPGAMGDLTEYLSKSFNPLVSIIGSTVMAIESTDAGTVFKKFEDNLKKRDAVEAKLIEMEQRKADLESRRGVFGGGLSDAEEAEYKKLKDSTEDLRDKFEDLSDEIEGTKEVLKPAIVKEELRQGRKNLNREALARRDDASLEKYGRVGAVDKGLTGFPGELPTARRRSDMSSQEQLWQDLSKDQKDNFREYKQVLESLEKFANSDIGWQKIRKINVIKNDEPLYDISIPKFRNFIANGCLVHNSTYRIYLRKSKDEKRIAKMMDSPDLPTGETVFKVTAEGIRDA